MIYCCRPIGFLEEITTVNEIGAVEGTAPPAPNIAIFVGSEIGISTELPFSMKPGGGDDGLKAAELLEEREKIEIPKEPETVRISVTKRARDAFLREFIMLRLF